MKHRSAEAQADLTVIRARAALVRARTLLVNAVRGLTKSYGERLRGCNARGMKLKAAQDLSPELKSALEPMMREVESISERICEYDQMLESMARNRYPEAERLHDAAAVYKVDTDAIALKVKQEFAAKQKTQTAKKTVAKTQPNAVKKAKAA